MFSAHHEDEALRSDTLELADTRPTMVWAWFIGSVPVAPAAMILTGFGVMMGVTGSWMWLPPIIPVWWLASQLIAADYHAFTRLGLWLDTSFRSLDAHVEGGASVAPFPVGRSNSDAVREALGLRRPRARGIA